MKPLETFYILILLHWGVLFQECYTQKLEQGFLSVSAAHDSVSIDIHSFFVLDQDTARYSMCSLRASSPIWASEASLTKNARARGWGKESLQPSLTNFHFHPRNPGTPQSVKIVTKNVLQIRKVTTACQVSLESQGRRELFIYKSLSYQH